MPKSTIRLYRRHLGLFIDSVILHREVRMLGMLHLALENKSIFHPEYKCVVRLNWTIDVINSEDGLYTRDVKRGTLFLLEIFGPPLLFGRRQVRYKNQRWR